MKLTLRPTARLTPNTVKPQNRLILTLPYLLPVRKNLQQHGR